MSVGAVIRYSMTLDGAQYMQELRRNIAETKAAEQAMKEEARAMGVVTVSAGEMRRILSESGDAGRSFGGGMSTAMQATRGFNAAQTAFSQAMAGNVVGALKSGTSAAKSFMEVMKSNPVLLTAGAIGAVALAVKGVADAMGEYKNRMGEIRAEHDKFVRSIAEIEGTDPDSIARQEIQTQIGQGGIGQVEIRKQQTAIASQVAAKKQELVETEELLRTTEGRKAAWSAVPLVDRYGLNTFEGKPEQLQAELEKKKEEYRQLLELQKMAKDAEAQNLEVRQSGKVTEDKQSRERFIENEREADLERERKRTLAERQNDFARQKELDAEPDEVKKLEMQKKHLREDYMTSLSKDGGKSAEGDLKRLEILGKIHEMEMSIAKVKGAEAKADADARRSLRERIADYENGKKPLKDQLDIIVKQMAELDKGGLTMEEAEKKLDLSQKRDALKDQLAAEAAATGVDEDEGEEAEADDGTGRKPRRRIGLGGSRAKGRRRMGMSRDSQDWMRKQMQVRREAVGFVPDSTHEKEPAAVKVEGTAEIKTLLQQIDKKLE